MRGEEAKAKKISDLFEKYKKTLKAPQGVVIDGFCEVVEDVIGMTLNKTAIRYSVPTKTLSVQVKGPLKSEILLRKQEILNHLKGRLGEGNAPREIL